MNIDQWIKSATKQLESESIASARLDCLILLEDTLDRDRSWILANPDYELNTNDIKNLDALLKRRSKHEPIAYIRGKSEFYGRKFIVSPATLQPRPETETMISLLTKTKDWGPGAVDKLTIIDVGTGSGCLAITAVLEIPKSKAIAIDVSPEALGIAKQNAKSLEADVKFYQGNLLAPVSNIKYQISNIVILANLPYVPDGHTINQAATQEPSIAIFGGADGLDLYRQMFTQISNIRHKISLILTESLPFQHAELAAIASSHGYDLVESQDLIQIFRHNS